MHNFKLLTDEEMAVRSLLMRLYRSRMNGEAYYPAPYVNGEAPGLEACGWIMRRELGWRMTEAGVKAWALMSSPVTDPSHYSGWLNELYYLSGKPIHRVRLGKLAQRMMKALAEGGTLPLAVIEAMTPPRTKAATDGLAALMRAAYVICDGDWVCLSVVGRQVAREYGWTVAHDD